MRWTNAARPDDMVHQNNAPVCDYQNGRISKKFSGALSTDLLRLCSSVIQDVDAFFYPRVDPISVESILS